MTDLSHLRPKLAELCGLKLYEPEPLLEGVYATSERDDPDTMIGFRYWTPDEDVSQAIRCGRVLTEENRPPCERFCMTLGISMTGNWCSFERWVYAGEPDEYHIHGESLPEAICLAISEALGWGET